MKRKIFSFFVLIALMMPLVVMAQANPCTGPNGDIGKCVSRVYVWSLGVSGLLAVVMIIFGGYRVMTAGGNASKASDGKSYIYSSLIGLVLLLASYLILNTINTDLTDFTTPDLSAPAPTQQQPPRGTP